MCKHAKQQEGIAKLHRFLSQFKILYRKMVRRDSQA